nr:hypothetical protein [Tanacetum cinerariifolium]
MSSSENDSLSLEEKSSSVLKRRLEKVVKSSQTGTSHSRSSMDSLGFRTRFSILDFKNSSDSFSEIVSRCLSPMMRESLVDKTGVIAIHRGIESVGCQKPGHLAARLGCAETKVATWDDLAFKLIILRWNVKHRNFENR